MTLVSANDPHRPKRRKVALDDGALPGLRGLRARLPDGRAVRSRRAPSGSSPRSTRRTASVLMAIERGKLQD